MSESKRKTNYIETAVIAARLEQNRQFSEAEKQWLEASDCAVKKIDRDWASNRAAFCKANTLWGM